MQQESTYRVCAYHAELEPVWNRLNEQASNGSFLFDRAYLRYHADRFQDASFLVFQGDKVVALLPAHRQDAVLYAHNGLSYGGLVVASSTSTADYFAIWQAILAALFELGIAQVVVKEMPFMYASAHQGDWAYWLQQQQAEIKQTALLSYNERATARWNYARRSAHKKATNGEYLSYMSCDFKRFWDELLCPLLEEKYQTKPVHSLAEISYLAQTFPENIQLALVEYQGQLVAGTVLYCTDRCIKTQYIATNALGRSVAALDYLFGELLLHFRPQVPYWDWGSSHGATTQTIQKGLLQWKASWGAQTTTQKTVVLPTNPGQSTQINWL